MHLSHVPLTLKCADLPLDQQKLNAELDTALDHFTHLLTTYFGRAQMRLALDEGIQYDLQSALGSFAQDLADVISSGYVTETLARSREATANMFEALAAGAHVAHKAAVAGDAPGDVVQAFAVIAACEGRPEVLKLSSAER